MATRRDKGEGCISQMANGKWTARLTVGRTAEGKQIIKAFYGKTEKEVKRKLKDYKIELIKNNHLEIKKETIEEYLTDWLLNTKKVTLKPSSFDRLENTCKCQIYPYIGWYQIGSITPSDLQTFINDRAKEQSHSSVKKIYEALNAAFSLAVQREYIVKNPMTGVVLPSNSNDKKQDIHFFTTEQIKLIKSECLAKYSTGKHRYRLGYAYILLLNTGMRVGEALALEWTDIDFKKRTLSITKSIAQIKNRDSNSDLKYSYMLQETPKTKNSVRTLYLNDNAYESIKELYQITGEYKYVLANSSGEPTTHKTLDRTFRQIQKRCEISPQYGVHTLRHTFASIMFMNGVDVKTVSAILGHSGTNITYNTYIHLIQEQKIDAMKILNNI